MQSTLLNFLASHPLFRILDREELEVLEPLVTEEEYPEASYIFLEEDKAIHFYILKEGLLRAMIGGKILATIRPGEFFGEVAVLSEGVRSGSVYTLERSSLVKIDGKTLFDGRTVPASISFKILKEIIKPLISLHYTNDFYRRTKDIIREGENEKVEFKSTLRYNLHTGKFGREIEHAAMKTIAAFLNSWGGILLVGVSDEKDITGIDADKFESDDRAMLHLTNMVKERLGEHFMQFINCAVEPMDQGRVMRIDVSPANKPAYLNYNNEEYFYVRTGPSTSEMKPSRIYDYIENRFYRPRA